MWMLLYVYAEIKLHGHKWEATRKEDVNETTWYKAWEFVWVLGVQVLERRHSHIRDERKRSIGMDKVGVSFFYHFLDIIKLVYFSA